MYYIENGGGGSYDYLTNLGGGGMIFIEILERGGGDDYVENMVGGYDYVENVGGGYYYVENIGGRWWNMITFKTSGVKIRLFFVRASRAPSLSKLGALIRICGPWCKNATYLFIFDVLASEISRGLSAP